MSGTNSGDEDFRTNTRAYTRDGETAGDTAALIPQPHGGALRAGGKPGNRGGRPASAVRRRLRGSFAERIDVLQGIADGTVTVNLRQVCEHCGQEPTPPSSNGWLQDVLRRVRAAVGDQLKALDIMAKYGLGPPSKTITEDDIRERIGTQLAIIRESPHVVPGMAEALIDEIEKAWVR